MKMTCALEKKVALNDLSLSKLFDKLRRILLLPRYLWDQNSKYTLLGSQARATEAQVVEVMLTCLDGMAWFTFFFL